MIDILVTGGAGYIGSVLVPELLKNPDVNVTVLDNFRYKQKPLLDQCHNKNLDIVVGDVREISTTMTNDFDVIIHLAAIVGAQACDLEPFDANTTNMDATLDLVDSLSGGQWLIYPCTNSGYGIGQKDTLCTEESPLKPISLYGQTKVNAEKAVLKRTNSISFRLATVFGASPCMRTELLVNNFVLRALRDKCIVLFEAHFKRNYIHVRDVVQAILFGLDNFDDMKGNAYNVGLSEANLSKYELCEKIKKHIDFEIISCDNRKDPDQRDYIVSNEKIEKLGWRPTMTLDDGIEELIKAYQISIEAYHGKYFAY